MRLIPPSRGNILDRNNKILALNKNSYNLLLSEPKNTSNIEESIKKISNIIFLDQFEIENILENYKKRKKKIYL